MVPSTMIIKGFLGLFFCLTLTACGQRGPLYLPDQNAQQTEQENHSL